MSSVDKAAIEKLNVKVSNPTEEYKRSNHKDFMDSRELEKAQHTGYRLNSITNDCEIWLKGKMVKSITAQQLALNPMAVGEAMEEIFAMKSALPDTAIARAYGEARDRQANK